MKETDLAKKTLSGRNTLGGVSLMVFLLGTHAVGDEVPYHSCWFKRSITDNRENQPAKVSSLHEEDILSFLVLKGKNRYWKALHVVLKFELSPPFPHIFLKLSNLALCQDSPQVLHALGHFCSTPSSWYHSRLSTRVILFSETLIST